MQVVTDRRGGVGTPEAAEDQFFAMLHILFHEYGHAVSFDRRRRVMASEEDSADAIAAYMVGGMDIKGRMLQAILSANMKNAFFRDTFLRSPGDVHSSETERRANAICWIAGDDQAALAAAVRRGYIAPGRAAGCEAEQSEIKRRVANLLMM